MVMHACMSVFIVLYELHNYRGKIKGVIKELINQRVKLKMAERLAEGLAQHVKSQLSDKETRIREQYETQLERLRMTLHVI